MIINKEKRRISSHPIMDTKNEAFTQINEQLFIIGYKYCEELLELFKKENNLLLNPQFLSPNFWNASFFSSISSL